MNAIKYDVIRRLAVVVVVLTALAYSRWSFAADKRMTKVITASTNATFTTATTGIVNGIIRRIAFTIPAGKTSSVSFVDIDGTTLISTNGCTGTILLDGLSLHCTTVYHQTKDANTNGIVFTNSITVEY